MIGLVKKSCIDSVVDYVVQDYVIRCATVGGSYSQVLIA